MATLQMVKAIKLESVFLKIAFLAIFGVLGVQDSAYAADRNSDFDDFELKEGLLPENTNSSTAVHTVGGSGTYRAPPRTVAGDFDDDFELPIDKFPPLKKSAGVVVVNKSPSSSEERDRSGSSSHLPSANTSGTSIEGDGALIVPVPMLGGSTVPIPLRPATGNSGVLDLATVLGDGGAQTPSLHTQAFLNQLNRSLKDEWSKKVYGAFLALGAAYGYYGYKGADYMQLSEYMSMPDSLFCTMATQEEANNIYLFIYNKQFAVAVAGKVFYGSVLQCIEWCSKLAKRYQVDPKACPKIIGINPDLETIESTAHQKLKYFSNGLGLVLAGGSAMVDASLYGRYIRMAIYPRSPISTEVLGAGLALDNYDDVQGIVDAGFRKVTRGKTLEQREQRSHLRWLFRKSAYQLQTASDEEIKVNYACFKRAGSASNPEKVTLEQLRHLLAAGRDTDLPNRRLRNLSTKGVAATLTGLSVYAWWVLGNGIIDGVDVVRGEPTAASATLGVLNVLIAAPLAYDGTRKLGNAVIDSFAPRHYQLPHANHRDESNVLKRICQVMHTPGALILLSAGSIAATTMSLYFTIYPAAPWEDNMGYYVNTTSNYSNALNGSANESYSFVNDSLVNGSSDGSNSTGSDYYSLCGETSFFYSQARYIVYSGAFLLASASRPLSAAMEQVRSLPSKCVDAVCGAYNKIRGWCGYEPDKPEVSIPAMRDEMMRPILEAGKMLARVNDETIASLHRDLKTDSLPGKPVKQGWGSWAKQLVGW